MSLWRSSRWLASEAHEGAVAAAVENLHDPEDDDGRSLARVVHVVL